jgi:hypothetical protein
MDGNATPRHARRRASLATSSNVIRTDSQAAASHRHLSVIALSTAVMRFGYVFAAAMHLAPQKSHAPRAVPRAANRPTRRERSQRRVRVNDAPTRQSICTDPKQPKASALRDSSIQNHSMDCPVAGESPLSGAVACWCPDGGDRHRGSSCGLSCTLLWAGSVTGEAGPSLPWVCDAERSDAVDDFHR